MSVLVDINVPGPTLVPDIGRSDSTDVTEIYYFYASVSSREDIFVNKAGGNQARQGYIFCNLLYGLGLYERNGSGGGGLRYKQGEQAVVRTEDSVFGQIRIQVFVPRTRRDI